MFEANGALAPRVLWQPTSAQIQTPQLRFLLDYWTKLKGDARLPANRSIDLSALAAYRRGEPAYANSAPAGAVIPNVRHSLLLPLADDAGKVGGFLHGTVPIGAGGLPIPTRF